MLHDSVIVNQTITAMKTENGLVKKKYEKHWVPDWLIISCTPPEIPDQADSHKHLLRKRSLQVDSGH